MCLGIPGQIIEMVDDENHIAKVNVSGVKRNVNIMLVRPDGIVPGDWVLIHVGFAMSKIAWAKSILTNSRCCIRARLNDYRSPDLAGMSEAR